VILDIRLIKLIKCDSKTFIMLQETIFQIHAVLLTFLFIKESGKLQYITVSSEKLSPQLTRIIIITVIDHQILILE